MLTTHPTKYPLTTMALLLPSLSPQTRDVGLFLMESECSRCMDWDGGGSAGHLCTEQCHIIAYTCPPQSTSNASTQPHWSAMSVPTVSDLTNSAYISRCHICPTIPMLMSNATQMHTMSTTRGLLKTTDNNKHNDHWCQWTLLLLPASSNAATACPSYAMPPCKTHNSSTTLTHNCHMPTICLATLVANLSTMLTCNSSTMSASTRMLNTTPYATYLNVQCSYCIEIK